MQTKFIPGLSQREFGAAVFSTMELSKWMTQKGLHMPLPQLDGVDFVQIEFLLCAIESNAFHEVTFDQAKELEKFYPPDPDVIGSDNEGLAGWRHGANAHWRWRKLIRAAIASRELRPLDFVSKLPLDLASSPDEPPQHGAEASQPAKARQPLAEAPLDDPRMRIQAEAAEHWIRLLASNCSPTVNGISEHMADWCTKNDVKTKGGISPRAGTIRNSILNAQSWTPPQMDRSKAREYIDAKKQAAQVAQPAQVSQVQGVQPVKEPRQG